MSTPILDEETAPATDEGAPTMTHEQAWATPCSVTDCDGTGHDPHADPAGWAHQVVNEKFDNGIISGYLWRYTDRSKNFVAIDFEGDGQYTVAELYEAADAYEAFPNWLRSLAVRLEQTQQPDDDAEMTERRLLNAQHVRDALTLDGKGVEDLQIILDVTPGQALDLWSGRAWFDVQQLEDIGNVLNLDVADFMVQVVS